MKENTRGKADGIKEVGLKKTQAHQNDRKEFIKKTTVK